MYLLVNLFRYFRWLSLDIALGGAILVSFVGEQFELEVGFFIQTAVSIAIWMIYTADHLWDAKNLESPSMARHQFHKQNFKNIALALVVTTCLGALNLFFLPQQVLIHGVMIVLIVAVYFLIQKRLSLLGTKELVIALVYSASMFLYPHALLQFELMHWLMLTEMVFIALSNLCIITLMEAEMDRQDGTSTILNIVSERSLRVILSLLLIILVGFTTIELWFIYQPFQLFILLAASVLLTINIFPAFFSKQERYRWIGDAVFFIPFFL